MMKPLNEYTIHTPYCDVYRNQNNHDDCQEPDKCLIRRELICTNCGDIEVIACVRKDLYNYSAQVKCKKCKGDNICSSQ